jgi:putative ABC transport system ATP-binding protein
LRQKNVGFVFQSYNLIPSLTAAENVAVPLVTGGMSLRQACNRAIPLMERVGLKEKARAYPAQLSGGQQQRVAIARSLIHRPRLIVCDEPTSALDHRNGELAMELLKEESRSSGCTIIVVTHDSRIFHHGDRIATMDDGRIISVKNREEYTNDNS